MVQAALLLFLFQQLLTTTVALDNGVARVPPLGWMTWQRFRCNTNCSADPHNCVSEALIKRTAESMVSAGFKDAGYEYVSLDACWNTPGSSDADPVRFPSGIRSLADFVHSKGLKLGLYTSVSPPPGCAGDYGLSCVMENLTSPTPCAKAKTAIDKWMSWGIDSIKVDGCIHGPALEDAQLNRSYIIVGDYLRQAANRRGKPVLYHPSGWSFVYPVQYEEIDEHANQFRHFDDIDDGFGRPDRMNLHAIIEYWGSGQPHCDPSPLPENCTGLRYPQPYGPRHDGTYPAMDCAKHCSNAERFVHAARPGAFPDPDMLLVGQTACSTISQQQGMHCRAITPAQEQTQMALWAIFAAPLMMSNDLEAVSSTSRAMLTNRECLRINQDPLGRQGRRIVYTGLPYPHPSLQVWARDLQNGDIAVALYNFNHHPTSIGLNFTDVGYSSVTAVRLLDVFGNGKVSNTTCMLDRGPRQRSVQTKQYCCVCRWQTSTKASTTTAAAVQA